MQIKAVFGLRPLDPANLAAYIGRRETSDAGQIDELPNNRLWVFVLPDGIFSTSLFLLLTFVQGVPCYLTATTAWRPTRTAQSSPSASSRS